MRASRLLDAGKPASTLDEPPDGVAQRSRLPPPREAAGAAALLHTLVTTQSHAACCVSHLGAAQHARDLLSTYIEAKIPSALDVATQLLAGELAATTIVSQLQVPVWVEHVVSLLGTLMAHGDHHDCTEVPFAEINPEVIVGTDGAAADLRLTLERCLRPLTAASDNSSDSSRSCRDSLHDTQVLAPLVVLTVLQQRRFFQGLAALLRAQGARLPAGWRAEPEVAERATLAALRLMAEFMRDPEAGQDLLLAENRVLSRDILHLILTAAAPSAGGLGAQRVQQACGEFFVSLSLPTSATARPLVLQALAAASSAAAAPTEPPAAQPVPLPQPDRPCHASSSCSAATPCAGSQAEGVGSTALPADLPPACRLHTWAAAKRCVCREAGREPAAGAAASAVAASAEAVAATLTRGSQSDLDASSNCANHRAVEHVGAAATAIAMAAEAAPTAVGAAAVGAAVDLHALLSRLHALVQHDPDALVLAICDTCELVPEASSTLRAPCTALAEPEGVAVARPPRVACVRLRRQPAQAELPPGPALLFVMDAAVHALRLHAASVASVSDGSLTCMDGTQELALACPHAHACMMECLR